MTLRDELLQEHSKQHAHFLAKKIGPSQEDFDKLMTLFLCSENQVAQRAAWIVSLCVENHPFLLQKHMSAIIENMQNPVHDAVKRNTLRILQQVEIPEELMGLSAEICFQFLNSAREPVAVKVFAMTVLGNIASVYPELKMELKISIEDQLPFASAGFQSRAKTELKRLEARSDKKRKFI
ncbi:MAG: hypothetical protein HC819_17555 [Cyclobacteriaceae bacterium]|nr:hypothetical protein [Cyclobacteriaceae bacterium]